MPYVGRTPSAVPVTADDIPANSIDASKIIDGAIAVADVADNAITDAKIADATIVNLKSGRKNLIINGGFDVWQRGTSFSSPASAEYTADRWKVMGTVTTVSKVTNGLSITATSGDSFMQDIEAMNVKAGNYIFSFTADDYSKINNIGCYSMGGGTHYGYATKLSDGVYSLNLAEVNRAGSSIRFEFYLAVGTVVLSNVQLELGSVATDFEHRSYGEELALCQRYYQKIGGDNYAYIGTGISRNGASASIGIKLQPPMREKPTVTKSGSLIVSDRTQYDNSVTSIDAVEGDASGMEIRMSTASGMTTYRTAMLSSSSGGTGHFHFDAEL